MTVALIAVVGAWKSITATSTRRTPAAGGAVNEVYAELQEDEYIVTHESASNVFFDLQVGAYRVASQTLAGALPYANYRRVQVFYAWAMCGVPCAANDPAHNLRITRGALESAIAALAPFVH